MPSFQHDVDSLDGLNRADQYSSWEALTFRHDVQHPMIAICEVDIRMRRLSKHNRGTRRESCFGVTGQILLANIGFRFCDETDKFLSIKNPYQTRTDQFARNGQSWAV